MAEEGSLPGPGGSHWVAMGGRRVPKSVVCRVLQLLDLRSLAQIAQVSRAFRLMTNDPSVFNSSTLYTGPNPGLPELQHVVPFPPPAIVGTTLSSITQVSTAPQTATSLPADTAVFMPVLPEAVPMFAQVPDVVVAPGSTDIVKISQILPGYAPSYATDYVPPEVSGLSFSAFANTISINVSRYPALSEVVDSKAYSKRKSGDGPGAGGQDQPNPALRQIPLAEPNRGRSILEYVPAEYFRGESSLAGPPITSVYCASRVDFVRPDVLASGRLLTNMTSQAVSATTSSETYLSSSSTGDSVMAAVDTEGPINGHGDAMNGD